MDFRTKTCVIDETFVTPDLVMDRKMGDNDLLSDFLKLEDVQIALSERIAPLEKSNPGLGNMIKSGLLSNIPLADHPHFLLDMANWAEEWAKIKTMTNDKDQIMAQDRKTVKRLLDIPLTNEFQLASSEELITLAVLLDGDRHAIEGLLSKELERGNVEEVGFGINTRFTA